MTGDDIGDRQLAMIARANAGMFTRAQALASGLSARTVDARLARGVWIAVHRGVYCAATTPQRPETRAVAAIQRVGGDAMFSHLTAARLSGLEVPAADRRLWITTDWRSAARSWPGVIVARTRQFPDAVERQGQPVTPIERTFLDMAGIVDTATLMRCLHDAARIDPQLPQRLITLAERRGPCRGLAALRTAVRAFDPEHQLQTEADAHAALTAAGMSFQPQYALWDGWFLVARFDFGDDEVRLALELDGSSHSSYAAQQRDRQRDRRVRMFGWTTARYSNIEVADLDRFVTDVAQQREALIREHERRELLRHEHDGLGSDDQGRRRRSA